MEQLTSGTLGYLSLLWVVLVALWLALLGYRAVLASREEDTLFLTKGESGTAEEQHVLVGKLERLSKPIWAFGVLAGVLLLTIVGIWIWHGMSYVPQ
ncbi:MAG TPA: hypothetical protein VGZ48_09720 [Candidatus Acidoferrales bacterium]|jgi:hypothetical protein|nr:hypothetical protein [Candidatus Acidoferrales bacterium]